MAATEHDDSPDSLRAKQLRELLSMDGWHVFEELIEAEWGAERVLQKTEQALQALAGSVDQATINDTVQQIHAARRAVQQVKRLPYDEIARLTPQRASRRPFDALRRVGR